MTFSMLFNYFGVLFIGALIYGSKAVSTNVAINKTVTSSSLTFAGWNELDNIVDGYIGRDGNKCECCAATQLEADPWVTVDLGQEYWIDNVVVYGRTDTDYLPQSFLGLQLHFTNSSGLQGDEIYKVEGEGWINFVNVTVQQHLQSRYVTLVLKGSARALPVCELEVYGSVSTNVAVNSTVTSSSTSTYGPFWAELDNIVDGNIKRDGNTCKCCAATKQEADPWITVDLGEEYWIDNFVVYGRTDDSAHIHQSLSGLQIHFTDNSGLHGDGFFTVEGDGWIDFVNVTVQEQLQSRYVTLLVKGIGRTLLVCELEVYGTGASSTSSTIYPGTTSLTTYPGTTTSTIYPATTSSTIDQGTLVSTTHASTTSSTTYAACEPGSFGQDCNSMCGKCYDNAPCDSVTGACDQCMAGFKGVTCSTACQNGTYGINCRWDCGHCYGDQPCNKVDGTCERCDLGYLGDLCETECISGIYGQDCSILCGLCLKYETCNHVTGLCSNGCAAGRQGDTCKQACGKYTFGVNCRQQCHCVDDKSCDSINGECEDGSCAEGFFGVDCQQMNGGPDKSDGNNQGIIIGVVSGVACIIIVLVIAGVCFLKRRKRDDKSSEIVTKPTDEHHYEDLHIHLRQL